MRNLFSFILTILTASLLVSCNEKKEPSLNESEYYLNNCLSSISAEGDSVVWVGTEFGEIIFSNNSDRRQYQVGSNRIYKVYTQQCDGDKRICWIAIRNAGLSKWEIAGNSARCLAEYTIPKKGQHYSVYDIMEEDGLLLAATSQGVYTLNLRSADSALKPIYPNGGNYHSGDPFVTKTICRSAANQVLVATQNGLLHIDVASMKTRVSHKGERINFVSVIDGETNILAGNKFYIEHKDGSLKREVDLKFHANLFYYVGGAYCFLDNSTAVLTRDLEKFYTISLRRNIPMSCNNVIVSAKKNDHVCIATENAVWKVPVHQSVFNDNAAIMSAATDENGDIYYINAHNEIFLQPSGSDKAYKIFDFIREAPIVDSRIYNGCLYYVTSNHDLKQVSLTSYFIRNILLSHSQMVYDSQSKITSMGLMTVDNKPKLYLGIQDGLIEIEPESKHIDTIPSFNDKYITKFYQQSKDNNLYLTTLNHGIFYGSNGRYKPIAGTGGMENIRSMAITKEFPPQMIVLAGNSLLIKDGGKAIDAKAESDMFAIGDSVVYTLPEFGIRKYVKKADSLVLAGYYYQDISFERKASVVKDDKVYLGCELGVLTFTAGKENQAQWVKITNSSVTRRRMVVTIVCLLLIVSAIFVGYRFYRYLATRTIRVRKEELKKRLAGIESVSNLFSDDYKSAILALYKDIAEIGLGKHHSWKANNEKIAAISDTLMRMNRSNVFMLLKKIDQQRERLASLEIADSKLLADNSQRALSNGDIEVLRSQALANEQWLSAYEKVQKELSGYMFQLRDVIIIKGLSDGILTEIDEYKQLLTTDPMESLDGKLQEIRRRYNRLFLDDALQTLRAYFASRSKRLDALDANDHVVEAVRMQLDSVTSDMQQQDRLTLLRQLKHTDRRIEQVVLRRRLQKEMDRYTFIRRTAISENEERVVQVDEKRLECEIATRSDEATHNISLLIADIYACMSDTDPRLVNSILKFNGFDNQQAKVLMLLIADAKVKRTAVPGMLRVVGNLNPVISRLLKNKIKPSEDEIRQYVERHPASLASYILKLIE